MFNLYFNQTKLPKASAKHDCELSKGVTVPYVYQDMDEAFNLVRKVLEEQLTTRNIL